MPLVLGRCRRGQVRRFARTSWVSLKVKYINCCQVRPTQVQLLCPPHVPVEDSGLSESHVSRPQNGAAATSCTFHLRRARV